MTPLLNTLLRTPALERTFRFGGLLPLASYAVVNTACLEQIRATCTAYYLMHLEMRHARSTR
jgi:hypothetical protein